MLHAMTLTHAQNLGRQAAPISVHETHTQTHNKHVTQQQAHPDQQHHTKPHQQHQTTTETNPRGPRQTDSKTQHE